MTTVIFEAPPADDRVISIRNLAEQGLSTKTIALKLGLSYGTIYSLARKHSIKIRREMKVGDISSQIAEKNDQGMTVTEIAAALGVSDSTVRKSAKDNGIDVSGRKRTDADGNPIPKKDRISEKRRQRLILVGELFDKGVRSSEIARQLGCTRELIRQDLALLELNASDSNRMKVAALAEEVRLLASQGKVASEIASLMNISVLRVRGMAEKFDIEISRLKMVDHGTMLSYQRGCTCDLCREANSQLAKDSRDRRIQRGIPEHLHGTDTGYRNWRCKCDRCKLAGAETNRRAAMVPGLAANKKNAKWTAEEDEMVADRSITARELALRLDRTVSSINTRRAILKRGEISPVISM